jgi:hypothetical protein
MGHSLRSSSCASPATFSAQQGSTRRRSATHRRRPRPPPTASSAGPTRQTSSRRLWSAEHGDQLLRALGHELREDLLAVAADQPGPPNRPPRARPLREAGWRAWRCGTQCAAAVLRRTNPTPRLTARPRPVRCTHPPPAYAIARAPTGHSGHGSCDGTAPLVTKKWTYPSGSSGIHSNELPHHTATCSLGRNPRQQRTGDGDDDATERERQVPHAIAPPASRSTSEPMWSTACRRIRPEPGR